MILKLTQKSEGKFYHDKPIFINFENVLFVREQIVNVNFQYERTDTVIVFTNRTVEVNEKWKTRLKKIINEDTINERNIIGILNRLIS